jgi:hypothetical protein
MIFENHRPTSYTSMHDSPKDISKLIGALGGTHFTEE